MRHDPTGALMRMLPLALLLACGPGAPALDVLVPADTADTAGPYEITAIIEDSDRIVEARVYWFVGDEAAPRPLALERSDASDRWRAQVPGQPAGVTVRLYVEVETDDGLRVRAPADSPGVFAFSIVAAGGEG